MASVQEQQRTLLEAYDTYADALFRHCYFRVYDRDQARDLVQDIFVRVWEYVRAGNSIENMRAFLYRVANNLVIDHVRRHRTVSLDRMQEAGFDPHDASAGARAADITAGREAVRVLEKLEEPYRAVMVMRYIDDMMPREIAEVLGESENAVSVRIHRALRKTRKIWEGEKKHEA